MSVKLASLFSRAAVSAALIAAASLPLASPAASQAPPAAVPAGEPSAAPAAGADPFGEAIPSAAAPASEADPFGEGVAPAETVVIDPSSPLYAPPVAAPGEQVAAGESPPKSGRSAIYDQRAKKMLAAEGRAESSAPHPLAAAHPGHHVVVCEAGCARGREEIVYLEAQAARGPIDARGPDLPPAAALNAVDCVGGCYYGRQSYAAAAPAVTPADGWISVVTPMEPATEASAPPKASPSRWYERINPGTAR